MKIRLSILVLTTVFLLDGCASTPKSASIIKPSAGIYQSANIYEYYQAPYFWFFPKKWARWDGYKITNKNWNQLNNRQKLMFILEGIKELESKEAVRIKINDQARTIVALNYSVDKINKELPKTEVSMLSFMYDVLKDAKMVTPRKVKIGKK